ncbi:MAG: alpha/beta fold hydrolase [Pseudomonadota bacterium]
MQTPSVILIPGISNSGPTHWQTRWEVKYPNTIRLQQSDWDHPDCDQWAEQLEVLVRTLPEPPLLVAHSLGCLVVGRWASQSRRPIQAALLVAVPDPAGPSFPAEATGFSVLPPDLGHSRVVMVSSTNDPFASAGYSQQRALAWNAEHITLGAQGHINGASGLGDWDQGWEIVERLST